MRGTKKEVAKDNVRESSHPVTIISLRIEEEKLLEHINISIINKGRFNINNYSDMFNIPRSTTRSRLKKLNRIKLIYYNPVENIGDVKILETGKIYLENAKKIRDDIHRKGGRKEAKRNELSVHWHKFSFEIINKEKFRKERLDFINCSWKENKGMKNWTELIIKFDDATIIIKPKTLILELKDVLGKEVLDVDSRCLRRMVEYSELLSSLGLKLGKTTIERGHWARVDSLLSDIIYKKIGEKYYLLDEDGNRIFWIDFSQDKTGRRKKENEVPDKLARENLDYNIEQQLNNKFDFNKIDYNSKEIRDHKEVISHAIGTLGQYDKQIALHLEVEKRKLELTEKQLINEERQTKMFEKIIEYIKNK